MKLFSQNRTFLIIGLALWPVKDSVLQNFLTTRRNQLNLNTSRPIVAALNTASYLVKPVLKEHKLLPNHHYKERYHLHNRPRLVLPNNQLLPNHFTLLIFRCFWFYVDI